MRYLRLVALARTRPLSSVEAPTSSRARVAKSRKAAHRPSGKGAAPVCSDQARVEVATSGATASPTDAPWGLVLRRVQGLGFRVWDLGLGV